MMVRRLGYLDGVLANWKGKADGKSWTLQEKNAIVWLLKEIGVENEAHRNPSNR